ncbi:MAG: saccharopine dehydrogenase C-terminal domain-containing protein, partial [Pseudomonadota bacterium]
MKFRYTVLGAGFQGTAIGYDLAVHGEADQIRMADQDLSRARDAAGRINRLVGRRIAFPFQVDCRNAARIRRVIRGSHAVVSALPYFLNLGAAKAALEEKAHFSDLGGNTDVVRKELGLHRRAVRSGVSLLPDCGLAPGLSNLLAARAIEKLVKPAWIHARCGGLPQTPHPPFNYKFVFSLNGLINEYSGDAIVLRDGRIRRIPALAELESVRIPGMGMFEAAVTTGGTSTAPYSFRGKVKDFDYKTLRYPGHFEAFKGFSDLGLFSTAPVRVGNQRIIPREFLIAFLAPLIDFPKDRDLAILLVEAAAKVKGETRRYRALMIDRGDTRTSFSA